MEPLKEVDYVYNPYFTTIYTYDGKIVFQVSGTPNVMNQESTTNINLN